MEPFFPSSHTYRSYKAQCEDTSCWPSGIKEVYSVSDVCFEFQGKTFCNPDLKRRLDSQARILAVRHRKFADKEIKLWAEDVPEREAIFIHAIDKTSASAGFLEIKDHHLRQVFRHFTKTRTEGIFADLNSGVLCPEISFTGCAQGYIDEHSVNDTSYLETLLTQDLVESLLEAVHFQVNPFGDEWCICLPGFLQNGAMQPSRSNLGPALRSPFKPTRPRNVAPLRRPLESRIKARLEGATSTILRPQSGGWQHCKTRQSTEAANERSFSGLLGQAYDPLDRTTGLVMSEPSCSPLESFSEVFQTVSPQCTKPISRPRSASSCGVRRPWRPAGKTVH